MALTNRADGKESGSGAPPSQSSSSQFSPSASLTGIWLCAGLLWYGFCRSIQTPRIFGDELNYWDMARSFHQGARVPYWSVNYDIPTQLYSWVISPVFAFHGLTHAYQAARLVTPFLIAAAVFPAYLLARELLEPRYAFAVVILSVAIPSMTYSSALLTENLFYPLFLFAFWAAYRALCSGTLGDSVMAGVFFAVTYYTKPHVFVLIVAYAACTSAWLLQSLRSRENQSAAKGFILRLIPIVIFLMALLPRIGSLPAGERGLGAILFGRGYQQLLQAQNTWHLRDIVVAWGGLLLSTLIATLFVPFALYVASAWELKNLDWRRRWFWLLTAIAWLGYTALVARHTVLNDGSIRIHERYIFIVFPEFFVWYFLAREQQSVLRIAAVSSLAIAVGAAIMRWPAHVFLTPHVNTDSPALTGFLGLAWMCNLTFFWLAVLVALIGCAATLIALAPKLSLQMTGWTFLLFLLILGWVEFENRWIDPLHIRLENVALEISNQVGSRATVGVLLDNKSWLLRFHLDFWMERPTILYGIDRSGPVPGSFNWQSPYVRPLERNSQGVPEFGNPAPDYLLSNLELSGSIPVLRSYLVSDDTLYLYRVPQPTQP